MNNLIIFFLRCPVCVQQKKTRDILYAFNTAVLPAYFKLPQLCFCQILFELVYSWESYHKNKKAHFLLRHSVV